MRHLRWPGRFVSSSLVLAALAGVVQAQGQNPPRPRPNPVLRSLENKAQDAQKAYLSQLGDLATGYEDAGSTALAEETLRKMLRITPDDEAVKTRLKTLENKAFEENQRTVEVDVSRGWVTTGLKVSKGQPIRLQAEGSYRFNVNTDLGPDGFPQQDISRDMGSGVPCGALMGTVFPESAQRGRPQPTAPFTIGRGGEIKPDADGMLFVRLNVPPGSKSTGKVKLLVTGNIAPAGN